MQDEDSADMRREPNGSGRHRSAPTHCGAVAFAVLGLRRPAALSLLTLSYETLPQTMEDVMIATEHEHYVNKLAAEVEVMRAVQMVFIWRVSSVAEGAFEDLKTQTIAALQGFALDLPAPHDRESVRELTMQLAQQFFDDVGELLGRETLKRDPSQSR